MSSQLTKHLLLIVALITNGMACKFHQNISTTKEAAPSPPLTPGPQTSFYRPFDEVTGDAISEKDLVQKITEAGVRLEQQTWHTVMLPKETPERLLYLVNGTDIMPVGSYDGKTLRPWSQATLAEAIAGKVNLHGSNIVIRHAAMEGNDPSDDEIYMMYRNGDGSLGINSPMQQPLTSSGIFQRRGNQFVDEQGQSKFGFTALRPGLWRYQGHFGNGLLCEGALFWRDGTHYFHAVRQYGIRQIYQWHAEGDVLRLDGMVGPGLDLPTEADAMRDCPGKAPNEVQDIIESLAFDPNTKLATQATPQKADPKKAYPLGTHLIVDNAVFVVLFSATEKVYLDSPGVDVPVQPIDVPVIFLTNLNRTYQEDKGKPYTRIYKYKNDQLEEIAPTQDFLAGLAKNVQDLSLQRLQASKDVAQAQDRGRWYLNNAELKANQVDSSGKLIVSGVATYAWELCFRGFSTHKTSILGVKSVLGSEGRQLESLAQTALENPDLRQRLLASFYMTMAAGITGTTQTLAATWETQTPKEQWDGFVGSVAQNGGVNGLRSLFPSGQAKWVAIGVSGLVMRWRKLNTDAILGYDNGSVWQEALNMTAGAATALISSYAQSQKAGSGVLNAIGGMGFVLSDFIAGRGAPGNVAGAIVEIGTNLFVKDPLIRPFAVTLSKQVNSLVQLLDAYRVILDTGHQLDAALALAYQQAAKRDALLWLLKNNPDAFGQMAIEDRNTIMASAIDPYALMRAYYGQKGG